VPQGAAVQEPVTLRDLPATVIDLLQIRGETGLAGHSLARFWDGEIQSTTGVASPILSEVDQAENVPAWIPVGKGDMKSLWMGSRRYIKGGDLREEIYDLAADSAEKNNLAESADRRTLDEFRNYLEAVLSGRHRKGHRSSIRPEPTETRQQGNQTRYQDG
jgi:hypothetical protein